MSEFLTTAEAADLLRCGKQKIRDLINAGHLEAVNTSMGKRRPRWVIPTESIEAFRQSRQAAPATKPRTKPPTITREWI